MIRPWIAAAALSLSTSFAYAQANKAPSGSLKGHIICSDTNTPCRFASVILQAAPATSNLAHNASAAPHSYSSATDLDGIFQIQDVLAGDYYILARLPGYLAPYDLVRSEFDEHTTDVSRALEAALVRIHIDPNQTNTTTLTLTRGASLEGTVRYDDGGLAINLPLYILRKDHTGKWSTYLNTVGDEDLAPLGIGLHTDDRGHFYEPGLPPGIYTVEVTLPQAILLPTGITGKPEMNVTITTADALRVFYGDKFFPSQAEPIEMDGSESHPGVDITLPSNGLHLVHGTVTAQNDGMGIAHGNVQLLDPNDKTVLREAQLQVDGSFTFNYVPRGTYIISIIPGTVDGQNTHSTKYESLSAPLLLEGDAPSLLYSLPPKH
jgi:hypothetical protein